MIYGKTIFGNLTTLNNDMICYLSEIGHKNFFYPTMSKAILNDHCDFEELNWISGDGRKLRAIKVKNKDVYPLTLTCENDIRLLENDDDTKIVVWIPEK